MRKVAARHGVSVDSIRRVVREDAPDVPGFGSEATRAIAKNGIAATELTAAQQRAEISAELLVEIRRAINDMRATRWRVFNFGGKDNTFEMRELDAVPVKDRQALATIAGILLDKHRMLDQLDSEQSRNNAVDAWLTAMTKGLADGTQ